MGGLNMNGAPGAVGGAGNAGVVGGVKNPNGSIGAGNVW